MAKNILHEHLCIKQGEKLLVVYDSHKGFIFDLVKEIVKTGQEFGTDVSFVYQKPKDYGRVDRCVANNIEMLSKNDCLFVCLKKKLGNFYSFSESGFRTYLRKKGIRFATLTGLGTLDKKQEKNLMKMIIKKESTEKWKGVKEIFENGSFLEIRGKSGTEVECNISGRKAWLNNGVFDKPGSGGNIPSGKIIVSPHENSVNGKFIVDISVKVFSETVSVKSVEFIVENGIITKINGDYEIVERIKEDLHKFSLMNSKQGFGAWCIKQVGEIGFGLVPGKLVGLNIVNECIKGVCFFSNGNTFGKGGKIKCRGHRSHLFFLDRIKLDGNIITF